MSNLKNNKQNIGARRLRTVMTDFAVYGENEPLFPGNSRIRFQDLFDLEEIQRIQDAFAEATGVASLIVDTEGQPLTRPSRFVGFCDLIRSQPKGLEHCVHSDIVLGWGTSTGPTWGTCLSGGLIDGGTGIFVGERRIANWLVGQVLEAEPDEGKLRSFAREIGVDEMELLLAAAKVPRVSRQQFDKILTALHLIAVQLSVLALKTWQQTQYIHAIDKAYTALRDSEERYRALMQQSSEAIVLIEPETRRVLEVNRHFREMLGYSPQEMESKTVYDFVADSKEAIDRYYDEILPRDRELPVELRSFRHKNGRIVEVERSGVLVHLAGRSVYMVTARDVSERRFTEEKLNFLSFHDTLTGLYNRAYFEETLLRLDCRRETGVGLIVFDLDGLKLVNDSFGHEQGDNLLVRAAELIGSCFRDDDVVARIGGDEFAVVMQGMTDETLQAAVVRVQTKLEAQDWISRRIPLSLSIGYALSSRAELSMRDLFREADDNMYREKLHRSQSTRSAIVQTVMSLLEARDYITEGHAERLQDMVIRLARTLGVSENRMTDLRLLAQFHDIGKVGIPDRILLKPKTLSVDEMTEMRRHCEIGHRIAQSSPDLLPIADWVLKHQEWWNGKGYPLGIAGEAIPLECRILSLADAYDAMTSDRPYRKALSQDAAFCELRRCSGTQFDPSLVELFIQTFGQTAENPACAGPVATV